MALGAVQGLTEFLPISSSGHLILAGWVAGWHGGPINSLAFDVALHIGTLLAILWYFRQDWIRLGAAVLRTAQGRAEETEARLVLFIALASIPAVITGFLFEDIVETTFRNPLLVAAALTVGSIIMYLSDKYSRQDLGLGTMTLRRAMFVGLAQAVALIPGISRSGITISAALAIGYKREAAARFSFLLATPIIFGAAVMKVNDMDFHGHNASGFILGIFSSAVVGYLAIRFLIRYLERHSLNLFVWYRLALAFFVMVLWIIRN